VSETRSLHRKLAQVMYEADRIPKNGTAPQAMGGFKFVQVGDAADVIRKALAEVGVSMLPSGIELVSESENPTSSGKMMTTMTVRTTWTLTDGDSGETAIIQSMGSGGDMGDKAIPKAQTNAMKYALLMGFLLSTGDDPELSDTSDRRARPASTAAALATVQEAAKPVAATSDGGLIGTIEVGENPQSDYELRAEPDGWNLGFRLVSPKGKIKSVATGILAEQLAEHKAELVGQRVTCWGRIADETFTPKVAEGKKPYTVTYQVLSLTRVQGAGLDLPEPEPPAPTQDEFPGFV